ncbi:MAG TPA: hypothetical protein VHA78_03725 [Candidatus Peribacteraceae bacterium]|nr:hypothetical protein [Candidatus Peribacteraceae bacterium]
MKQYQSFIFDAYEFDDASREIRLHYSLDHDVSFTETITLPHDIEINAAHPDLDNALFALHLIGGISYYKTCLPKTIEIQSGTLTDAQAQFWNEVYENGLGEFFYRNDIDFRGLVRFPSDQRSEVSGQKNLHHLPLITDHLPPRPLVPLGGGKDSLVTVELLRSLGFDMTLLRVGQNPLIDTMALETGFPLWNIKRALSPELFKLNEDGALNGHVPITGYLSFLSIVVALLTNRSHVIFSNEESANIGNTEFHSKEINHQWSKSLAFERMFQEYVSSFITNDVGYFSLLRPLSELKIAEIFSRYPKYLPLATSCNRNWKIRKSDERLAMSDKQKKNSSDYPLTANRSPLGTLWCGQCPKCAFTFALLAAFLPRKDLVHTFGKDLFEDASLLPLYRELLGLENFKPFECVGTPEETAAAFLLAHDRGEFEGSKAMAMFIDEAMPEITEPDEMIGEAMMTRPDHAIPDPFSGILKLL